MTTTGTRDTMGDSRNALNIVSWIQGTSTVHDNRITTAVSIPIDHHLVTRSVQNSRVLLRTITACLRYLYFYKANTVRFSSFTGNYNV